MGNVLITVTHRLQLGLVGLVGLGKGEIVHFFGDVPNEDGHHRLIEVLNLSRFDVHEERLFLLARL